MADKAERKRGVRARWAREAEAATGTSQARAETRLREARDRNLDSPGVSDTGAYGGPPF